MIVLVDEYTGNLNYKNKRLRYEEQEVESDPYYISSDFSIVYFSCIQIWLSAFNGYITKNMVFSVLIFVAGWRKVMKFRLKCALLFLNWLYMNIE
jgi:hypothetical protein